MLYLVKVNKKVKTLENIPVPANVNLEKKGEMFRVNKDGKYGILHKGYTLVEAFSPTQAYRKAFNIDIRIRDKS
jgi:hypothetical protein